ncbi:glycosyltransferase involved in cell wall biosynthesis [Salinibacter ruber]|uniref:glycosyltransferase family 4 protein n=1 Tax=Salinibacter ruber TaxID=146919 RepID=UPI0021686FBD|nr:glycosyltransferase family 4 protein [Salinibacter ruber]MCS3826465.1 glycosyltransferase involved in cell wall biosynthesis [Salinibacter ruber]
MILVYEQSVPHYRVKVYEKVGKRLGQKIVVSHGPPRQDANLKTINSKDRYTFEDVEVPTWWVGKGVFYIQNIIPIVRNYEPDFVLIKSAVRSVSFYPLVLYYKSKNIPVVIWGHGVSRKREFSPSTSPLDWTHYFYAKMSDSFICYTEKSQKKLSKYFNEEKFFVANNTIDINSEIEYKKKLDNIGQQEVKSQLCLESKNNIVFIGRVHKRKKLSVLVDSVRYIQMTKSDDVGLVVIGDGPELDNIIDYAKRVNLKNAKFVGEKYGKEAGKYLYACDVMVIPSWLGLAVNHAFAYGLPVVTQKKSSNTDNTNVVGHPPEICHLIDGKNGIISDPGYKNLSNSIIAVIKNKDYYSQYALEYALGNLTMERMVTGFEEAIEYAKN